MDRQPMTPVLLTFLVACNQFEPPAGAFEVPRAVAVLQPELGGPFEEPIGFVANGQGGQIALLALKQGRFLTDDLTGAFLPANQLATGDRRLLTSVAVHADGLDRVTVFAGDLAFGELLVLPYLEPCESFVCEGTVPSVTGGDGFQPGVKNGWTTTETWTLTPDGQGRWNVEGSRSGLQPEPVVPGEPWSAEDRRLQLVARAPNGNDEVVTIETDNGLRAIDVGGAPLALKLAPDHSVMGLIVQDRKLDVPRLFWFDPATEAVLGEVTLPVGAEPHRLSVSEGGGLLVADRTRNAFYEVPWGETKAVEFPTPWPVLDVAGVRIDTDGDGLEDANLRYVVPLDAASLWRYDPQSMAIVDVNPALAGDQGIVFDAPVQGIEAMPLPYLAPELGDDEERVVTTAVAVSLSDGRTVFAHEDTGCLVQDPQGPRTSITTAAGTASSDINAGDIPAEANFLARFAIPLDGLPNVIVVNDCAGIAKTEAWGIRFDQLTGTWEADGAISGIQNARVIEDQRYVSDDGGISFLLGSGSTPSVDGWVFTFSVVSGIAAATGDVDGDGLREGNLSVSGDPVFFFYRVGQPGPVPDGEDDVDGYNPNIRPFVLVPGSSTNRVGRVDPSDEIAPLVEVSWE
ncbi:MAG: hypothetical protein AAGA48_05655 [Myxococcota bacterium]